MDLIQLLLQTLGALMFLEIRALKIVATTAAAFRKSKRPRREVDKKARYKKANGQCEEKRYDSL